jgi:tetratricopeptide (TPR) repeat protein
VQQPGNAQIRFRLAAALMAAGQCDSAVATATAAQLQAPADAVGQLVIGACQEKSGRYDLAYATYTDFATRHPRARGVAAVRAAAQLALRTQATQNAKLALARESTLTALPPEPSSVAVLPLTIAGDSNLQPLSRGLAELITSDLALVRSLRLLERVQIGSVLDELQLSQSARVDTSTAARIGRLLRAERMVQGVATLKESGPVRLSASVVRGDGEVHAGPEIQGSFKRLLDLEKELVLGLATQLGIQLTEAERQRILRQGPRSLVAFLAYSQGLEAIDRGDYRAASSAFAAAVRADPTFSAARDGQQAADAAPIVQSSPGDVITIVDAAADLSFPAAPASLGALLQSTTDVSQTLSDVTSQNGISSVVSHPTPESQGVTSVVQASGVIRIIFKLP